MFLKIIYFYLKAAHLNDIFWDISATKSPDSSNGGGDTKGRCSGSDLWSTTGSPSQTSAVATVAETLSFATGNSAFGTGNVSPGSTLQNWPLWITFWDITGLTS